MFRFLIHIFTKGWSTLWCSGLVLVISQPWHPFVELQRVLQKCICFCFTGRNRRIRHHHSRALDEEMGNSAREPPCWKTQRNGKQSRNLDEGLIVCTRDRDFCFCRCIGKMLSLKYHKCCVSSIQNHYSYILISFAQNPKVTHSLVIRQPGTEFMMPTQIFKN